MFQLKKKESNNITITKKLSSVEIHTSKIKLYVSINLGGFYQIDYRYYIVFQILPH